GKDAQGRSYAASDPHLLTWVHLAEVKMFLDAFQTYGAQRLSAQEADQYVAQAGQSARLLGVPDPPQTVQQLDAQLADYRSELEVTPQARQAAKFLLLNPPVPLPLRPGYGIVAAGGVGLLPNWSRRMLGLYIPQFATGAVIKPVGRVGTSTIRWAMSALR
ncbi:MAG: oxygenase MpaB family protein, partial [Antricoccus sp.]